MLTSTSQEKILHQIFVDSCESETLDDFGAQVFPMLEKLIGTSASLLYRCNENRAALPVAGSLAESAREYYERYYPEDPTQIELRRCNLPVFRSRQLPDWRAYLKSPIYLDFQRPRQVHDFLHFRLLKDRHEDPGMVGILFARSSRQADFGPREVKLMATLLPALGAVARRSERAAERRRLQSCFDAILARDGRPEVALDLSGSLLWASPRAEELLELARGGMKALPESLVQASRRLAAALRRGAAKEIPPTELMLARKGAGPLRIDLRLARTEANPFVLAEIESPEVSPRLEEVARRFELTVAEKGILGLVSLGLSDREIGRRLFISRPTVRSHLGKILDKMGVHSRVQAALLAHGVKPELDSAD
ncbi:MAG TPA: helix-turn-helix transcriptional regulator [bacterium]|nr:helix-turn-helix transcriptional regulator [bacterium]